MECEICGRPIRGKGFKILVEGSEMTVCEDCKNYGIEKPKVSQKKSFAPRSVISKPANRPRDLSIDLGEELVENFHIIIRRERERRGWSQEDLAKKIQEKVSLIKKIENAEITPEPEVIEKLERVFDIKLRERVEEVKVETKRVDMTPTLGDVVVIRRKRKS